MKIYLNAVVDSYEADWLISNIQWSTDKEDDIYISSIGGSTDAGFKIANTIQAMNKAGKKKINTHLLSNADSIATVVFLAPPKEQRNIVQSSQMFVHDPRFLLGFAEVTKEDAEKMAERLEIEKNRIADFYVRNIEGLSKDEALSLMAGEKTLTADDMMGLNIVSEVLPVLEMAAIKQELFNLNRNKVTMGLFGDKKKPANIVNMGGEAYIVEGDVQKGASIQKTGELVDLNVELEMEDGKTMVIEKNVISDIKEKEEKPADVKSDELVDQTVKAVVSALKVEVIDPLEEKITALESKIQAIKTTPGAHVPDKKNGVENKKTETGDVGELQEQARSGIQKQLKEIQNKVKENRKTIK